MINLICVTGSAEERSEVTTPRIRGRAVLARYPGLWQRTAARHRRTARLVVQERALAAWPTG